MSVYSAEISAVKTVFCDFNFLVDHQGSEIVFDSLELEEDDFLVDTTPPICEYPLKSDFSVTILNINQKDTSSQTEEDFSATISLFEPITATIEVI